MVAAATRGRVAVRQRSVDRSCRPFVGTPGGAEGPQPSSTSSYDEWMTGSLSGPLARIKVDEKLLWDDRMEGGARGGVAVSLKAHGSSSVETSTLVSR